MAGVQFMLQFTTKNAMQQRKDNSIVASLFFFFSFLFLGLNCAGSEMDQCNNTMMSHTLFFFLKLSF